MTTATDPRVIRKVVTSALIGATIEWYDFFLYGVVAGIVFSKLYFPSDDPLISTLLAYTTFAVGFVTRPLGGVIFGHFGDRVGRKAMLILTLLLMGVPTIAIGLLPTYEQIGYWAAALLALLRFLQGVAVGGEWGGAVLMAVEHAPEGRRGFYGSQPQCWGIFLWSLSDCWPQISPAYVAYPFHVKPALASVRAAYARIEGFVRNATAAAAAGVEGDREEQQ